MGEKIIKSIFDKVIDGRIHSYFTWTGKSNNLQKKIAFSDYKEVIKFFYAVVLLADNSYTVKKCEKDLTYRVLKYAGSKR